MIKIEKGIPTPKGERRGCKRKYPFPDMVVGDSFFVSNEDYESTRGAQVISAAAYIYRKEHEPKWRFTCRKEENGFRCFRIK